jgi:hypothetical protein
VRVLVAALGLAIAASSGTVEPEQHDAAWRAATPKPRSAPPTPAANPFRLPIAFTAWGFQNGTFSAEGLAEQLGAAGVRSIAIQIGQADATVAAVFHARGIAVYLWGVPGPGDQAALEALRADGYIAQVEEDLQYHALLGNLARGVGAGLPRAVVTNFEGINATREGTLTPERMAPLAAAGVTTAFVECYLQHDPIHRDLPRMANQARIYGWAHAVPVIGLWGGVRLNRYDLSSFGRDWGFYHVEGLVAADWQEIAETR